MRRLILASASPRRRQILKDFGVKYRVARHAVDEDRLERKLGKKSIYAVACGLALAKAESAAAKLKKGIVLGADTIVVLKGRLKGKPSSKAGAVKMLSQLSSHTHRVITGFALIDAATGRVIVDYEETKVTFKKIGTAWIKEYVKKNNVMDKAGAYAVQENSDPFIKSIKGSYYNVVGLPVEKVLEHLKKYF